MNTSRSVKFDNSPPTSPNPKRNRSTSPEHYKVARSWQAISGEFGLKDHDPSFSGIDTTSFASTISSRPTSSAAAGHNSEDRIMRRATRSASPTDEIAVREILKSSYAQHRNPFNSIQQVPVDINPPRPSSSERLQDRIPNARLGAEVPVNDTTVLGTSQIKGCQGDFCHFNMHNMPSVTSSTGFRKRKKEKGKVAYQKQLYDAGLLDTPDYVSDVVDVAVAAPYRITYRSIIQARNEMPLVKLQLERHMRGEEGDYVLQDTYEDMAVGGKLPAHYYQEVPCCSSCFQVYTIIDRARSKSLLQKQQKKPPSRSTTRLSTINAAEQYNTHGHGEDDSASVDSYHSIESDLEGHLTHHQFDTLKALGDKTRRHKGNPSILSQESTSTAAASSSNKSRVADEQNLRLALQAIDGLTKMDVAEIRTMTKPPAAVEVVMEAVMIVLTGKLMSFKESYKLLSGGEAFLNMLKDFQLEKVTDDRLRKVEAYVDNPLFRPENVMPISLCAAKFCAWVHGIVHAARYQRGQTHHRIDPIISVAKLPPPTTTSFPSSLEGKNYLKPLQKPMTVVAPNRLVGTPEEELTFVQKLEKMKATKLRDLPKFSREDALSNFTKSSNLKGLKKGMGGDGGVSTSLDEPSFTSKQTKEERSLLSRSTSKFDPRPSPMFDVSASMDESNNSGSDKKSLKLTKRESKAMKAMQQKATDRLSAQTAMEGSVGLFGKPREYRCADGITKMPYLIMGKFSMIVEKCNFVVIHDFFDTYDATSILFKPLIQRHDDGCQIFTFNYPGQAHTVWPRLSPAERERGAKEPILSNDWIADRIHELLVHAEQEGDILLSRPFHLVGMGNGSCIAAAFAQKYANNEVYAKSLRSVVSVNGFLYPDAQLSSILHSAYQVFESTPHTRPDIAVSYWSRFMFSEEYLTRVNPNLALNIYTAVSNPITNDGRVKLARGGLAHRDIRGGLSPDYNPNRGSKSIVDEENNGNFVRFMPIQVPVVVLQATEDALVNASNVDSFLIGRTSKHLWSHMLNVPTDAMMAQAFDANAQWVGKMSTSPETYPKFSTLGKQGIRMLLDSLRNPRGAFVMWTRTGHLIQQEYKAAILDLFDILACPTDEYTGINIVEQQLSTRSGTRNAIMTNPAGTFGVTVEDPAPPSATTAAPLTLTLRNASTNAETTSAGPKSAKKSARSVSIEEPTSASSSVLNIDETIDDIFKNVIQTREDKPAPTASFTDSSEEIEEISSSVRTKKALKSEEKKPSLKASKESAVSSSSSKAMSTIKEEESESPAKLKDYWNSKEIAEHGIDVSPKKSSSTGIPAVSIAPVASLELSTKPAISDKEYISDRKQRSKQEWVSEVPDATTALALESELRAKQQEFLELEEKIRKLKLEEQKQIQSIAEKSSSSSLSSSTTQPVEKEKTKSKAKENDEFDLSKLHDLSGEIEKRQKERIFSEKQRRLEVDALDESLVKAGLVPAYTGPVAAMPLTSSLSVTSMNHSSIESLDPIPSAQPIKELPPLNYTEPLELPRALREERDIVSKLDQMLKDEEEARKRGILSMEDFERVKAQMVERQLERDQKLRLLSEDEVLLLQNNCAVYIQQVIRGFLGRQRAKKLNAQRQLLRKQMKVSVNIQRVMRGYLGRRRYKRIRAIYLANIRGAYSATQIQRIYRGYADRAYFRKMKRWHGALTIERVYRGHLGRLAANREKARLGIIRKKQESAAKIQSLWRMKVTKEEYRSLRIHILAAIEIQRIYRGYLGRKKMSRMRLWDSTKPGPERIKLGLQFIEESKQAFERQQEEIDALHRAQERAEARISHIHSELKDSEKELVVLERELHEIDQIERDLHILTHERNLLTSGIEDAAGMPRTAARGHKDIVLGKESTNENDPMLERRRRAEAYALEMTIQLKRAEREKKRQELEIEFASVFQEVEKKKKSLQRLELSLADMESTRERKDREFKRLQKNLMQLLMEQKKELDDLREKGLELETATATTAAAAVATAQKAKEHEKRSHAMFSQTEELMKFQFMSMSLSYFSSLNMLKSLRDMNADTTSAAIALSADASATAAGAAAAANLPNMKKLNLGADDFIEASIRKKREEIAVAEKSKKEYEVLAAAPLPDNVRTWTVNDVARWLETLSLTQYSSAFVEGSVDGPFLMELREEDLIQVLGIKHQLHVRKILLAREKLKPLTRQELMQKDAVEREENADGKRQEMGVPSLDTVFSQARNGRIKRVEESLNLGFQIDAEDEKGNTLLLLATQNSNRRLVEMLLLRGANINHQNAQGNTALHFAIAFDKEGELGEYLIEHGADDTIENISGFTPYDGVA